MADEVGATEQQDTVTAFRFILDGCAAPPADMLCQFGDLSYVHRSWFVPSIKGQTWALYDFSTAEERRNWEESLPSFISRFIDPSVIEPCRELSRATVYQ